MERGNVIRPVNSPDAAGRLPVLILSSWYESIFSQLLVLIGRFSRLKNLARNSNRVNWRESVQVQTVTGLPGVAPLLYNCGALELSVRNYN
jgi:hypothetical protein